MTASPQESTPTQPRCRTRREGEPDRQARVLGPMGSPRLPVSMPCGRHHEAVAAYSLATVSHRSDGR